MKDPEAALLSKMLEGIDTSQWRNAPSLPRLGDAVPAGTPEWIDDDAVRDAARLMLGMGARILVPVKGVSMVGAGICDGDDLEVVITPSAESNDIVVANVDGRLTVKTFFVDEYGDAWLAPHNPDFHAIRIADHDRVQVVGRVVEVHKRNVHGIGADALRSVMQARSGIRRAPTTNNIAHALSEVMDDLRDNRLWYAVYRVLVDRGVVDEGAYSDFRSLLQDIMGEQAPTLDLKDLRRMSVLSFSKPVDQWDVNEAPVGVQRARVYLHLARRFERALG